jgi:hypothetical protein
MNRVHIEFQRVQTWLFAVPRLRAMVGANALLGETLRVGLPKLARQTDKWLLAPSTEAYSAADLHDPLKVHDDPAADARNGILSRDGGHFEAHFASGAEAFADEAGALLRRELPGLRFRISIDRVEQQKSQAHLSTELPVLAPCEWIGRGLASMDVRQGDERASVSLDVSRRHEAARRAEDGTTNDLASLLVATTKLKNLRRAQELKDLVGSGYLALIHADGNDVGKRSRALSGAERDTFFHRNRVLLRRALQKAIDVACEGASSAPLIPLMLGGDDLLVVCRAATGLPFVVSLCETLEDLQREHASNVKLTLGVGVVFAKHTIPIYRLHGVAEQLAGSAKRRFRGFLEDERCSVVDWAVYSTAWVDDPEEVRRRDWLRGSGQDLRVLSQRPVNVLGRGLDNLRGLVEGAKKLDGAPRSQLRYVVEQLSRGRSLSELAFAELSNEARTALGNAGVKDVWTRSANGGPWLTELLDLIEISEIGRLGRADESHPVQEVADART